MEYIELLSINKDNKHIEYIFEKSSGLEKYFSEIPFELEYPDNIESVPDAVLTIPFVANVLPLIWLSNSELRVPELDEDFYHSISEFKSGYKDMYPEASFDGIITVNKVVHCKQQSNENNTAALFSGGLDAVTTLLRHIDEKPILISLWGSDIDCDNKEGWDIVENAIKNAANQFALNSITIKSSFRKFDKENVLDADYVSLLQRGWWYGAKHGIGIISHVAPYAYLHGIKKLYIASSNCVKDGKVRCASDPRIDSRVQFCGCNVVHDNYESSRQDKTRYLVKYRMDHNLKQIPLHVCWESNDGKNCGHCEKCYRTMVGFWIEGDDPSNYGFQYSKSVFKDLYIQMALREAKYVAPKEWTYMKEALNRNWDMLAHKNYRKKIAWIKTFDFFNLDNNQCRIRRKKLAEIKSRVKKAISKTISYV